LRARVVSARLRNVFLQKNIAKPGKANNIIGGRGLPAGPINFDGVAKFLRIQLKPIKCLVYQHDQQPLPFRNISATKLLYG
jgi:hypothetical protein